MLNNCAIFYDTYFQEFSRIFVNKYTKLWWQTHCQRIIYSNCERRRVIVSVEFWEVQGREGSRTVSWVLDHWLVVNATCKAGLQQILCTFRHSSNCHPGAAVSSVKLLYSLNYFLLKKTNISHVPGHGNIVVIQI